MAFKVHNSRNTYVFHQKYVRILLKVCTYLHRNTYVFWEYSTSSS